MTLLRPPGCVSRNDKRAKITAWKFGCFCENVRRKCGFRESVGRVPDASLIEYFLSLTIEERLALNAKNAAFLVAARRAAGIKDDRFDDELEPPSDARPR